MSPSDPISIPSASTTSNGQGSAGEASSPSARSLRSVSSTNSPPPNLDTDSLALLSQFRSSKAKQQAKFARLEAKAKREERERKKRQAGGVVGSGEREEADDGREDEEDEEGEQGFAESEAWGDLERLAKIEAGEVLSDDEDEGRRGGGGGASVDDDEDDDGILTVACWRDLVSEDYQQSQFWYSESFAYELARVIHARLERLASLLPAGRTPRIAFVCSPTAFVAFQDLYGERTSSTSSHGANGGESTTRRWKSGRDLFLLEIDERFTVAARHGGFIRYDFNVPLKGLAPLVDNGAEGVDMVVIDPPFLNEKTTDRVATSVHYLLGASPLAKSREASILLLTGDSIAGYAKDVYPLPQVEGQGQREPLRRTPLVVEHEGGRLSNEFGAWCSWTWQE